MRCSKLLYAAQSKLRGQSQSLVIQIVTKKQVFRSICRRLRQLFCYQRPSEGFNNHCHALLSCAGRFVLQVGDDDIVHSSVAPEILSCFKLDDVIVLKGIFWPVQTTFRKRTITHFRISKTFFRIVSNWGKYLCTAIPFGNPG
jgi:hypothetical protein